MTSNGGFHRQSQTPTPSPYEPKMNSDHDPQTTTIYEPMAIIGLSLRFSGEATSTEAFWNMMLGARCTVSDIPSTRLNLEAFCNSDPSAPGTIRPSKAHFLSEDISRFDSAFFNVSDAEATALDPQQRILLETTYHALENAGITMKGVNGRNVAVYVGTFNDDYKMLQTKDPEAMPKYTATGTATSMLSGRISSFFNLKGPSLTIDTACSSSLVALDQACRSLQANTSNMAIVAGSSLFASLEAAISLSTMGFLGPDGRCYSFDSRANGYGRGEGFGVVIIKRISDAIKDGDTIRAVIRATGLNQDGAGPLAQPNADSQSKLIRETYKRAGLDRSLTRYVEAHGTGTPIGDPIEATSIGRAFAFSRADTEPLYVGSVKANFGHLEGAAGIAGLIKAVLILERAVIPPLAGLKEPNPDIDLELLNLEFPRGPIPWPSRGLRRVSVNSFGFSGTNAHVVLDDAYNYLLQNHLDGIHNTVVLPPSSDIYVGTNHLFTGLGASLNRPTLLLWSAHDEPSLQTMTSDYQRWCYSAIQNHRPSDVLSSLSNTLLRRRNVFSWRSYSIIDKRNHEAINISKPSSIRSDLSLAFLFTGQGAQWHGMATELFQHHDVFRTSVLDAAAYLKDLNCDENIVEVFAGNLTDPSRLDGPALAQPVCTILQVAMIDLLASISLLPSVVFGHSSGEIAAAYACGAIDRASAWKLAFYRGVCSDRLAAHGAKTGGMISVNLSEQDSIKYIHQITKLLGDDGNLRVACINSPDNVTISGSAAHIQKLAHLAEERSIFARVLRVSVAYHGPHMEAIADEYRDAIGNIRCGKLPHKKINMISTVTGQRIDHKELQNVGYWVRNLVSPVRFLEAARNLFSKKLPEVTPTIDLSHYRLYWASDVLEIGPHSTLSGPVRDCLRSISRIPSVEYRSVLARDKDSYSTLMHAVAQLYCKGYAVDIWKFAEDERRNNEIMCLPALPGYPFNHIRSFWHEPTKSSSLRFRKYGFNEYLGTPVPQDGSEGARWKLTLNSLDSTWLGHHRINSEVIYPGAAMLIMAIEASIQLGGDIGIAGFEIEDVIFGGAIRINEDATGSRIEISMRLVRNPSRTKHAQYHFAIHLYRGDRWSEMCQGQIRACLKSPQNEVDKSTQSDYRAEIARHWLDTVSNSVGSHVVNGSDFYNEMQEAGYNFGSAFRRITDLRVLQDGQILSNVAILETPNQSHPSVVHPASLDGIFQTSFPLAVDKHHHTTLLPTYISKMFIAREGLLHESTSSLRVVAKRESNTLRKSTIKAAAFKPDGELKIALDSLEVTSISDKVSNHIETIGESRRLFWNVEYLPDIEMMDTRSLQHYLTESAPNRAPSLRFYRRIRTRIQKSLQLTLQRLEDGGFTSFKDHLQNYHMWMVRSLQNEPTATHSEAQMGFDEDCIEYDEDLMESERKMENLIIQTGEHLLGILTNQLDPLSILFRDNLLTDFYEEQVNRANYLTPMSRYLGLISHKNRSIRILEIGAGTGGATKHILRALSRPGSNGRVAQYSTYCFTDISPSFLSKAKENFAEYPNMTYSTLNIESDPLTQGFIAGSFDIVIASLVLHAVHNIDHTISNVRTLLKPGGKLLMIELVNLKNEFSGYTFGLLPGWWLSEETFRKERLSPCLTTDEWNQNLLENGFNGLDYNFWDSDAEEAKVMAFLIATLTIPDKSQEQNELRRITITSVDDGSDHIVSRFDKALVESRHIVTKCQVGNVPQIENSLSDLLIVFDSDLMSVLINLSAKKFSWLQKVFTSSRRILWVVPPPRNCDSFTTGPIKGLARVLLTEDPGLRFTVFQTTKETTSNTIHNVIRRCLEMSSPSESENEILERNGIIYVPRFIEAATLNNHVHDKNLSLVRRNVRFSDERLRLYVQTPGLVNSLTFVQAPALHSVLQHGRVRVQIKAIGVNFRDCLISLGRYPDNTFGSEFAGVVLQVGTGCDLVPGDRVMGSVTDTFTSVIDCNEALVVKIPDTVSFTEAAKIPSNFVTAHHALVEIGRLEPDETILIHAASGGTGQAAVQIAKLIGAEIYATVSNLEKKRLLIEMYGIAEDHIFYSRDSSFSEGIKKRTSRQGVDVILNSLVGDELRSSWEDILAPFGRFLEIGKRDISSREKLSMSPFLQSATFSAIDVSALIEKRPNLIRKALVSVTKLLAKNAVHAAKPLRVYDLNEIEHAFRDLQSGSSPGSIAIEVCDDAIVPALVQPIEKELFYPNATYVISGGLGGLGRSIVRWMAGRGAKALLLLSRQVRRDRLRQGFLDEMRNANVQIEVYACDISDSARLREVLEHARITMPPIRGCIQASMVLQDGLFSTMTYNDWKASTGPKIQGSWNLHQQLPPDLDFFILLSSMSGIVGAIGQSNYAAGNTYQDELSTYRLSRGQKAVSLDLSIMGEAGYYSLLGDDERSSVMFKRMELIHQSELFALLDYYCDPDLSIIEIQSQLAMGIRLPQELRREEIYPAWMDRPIFSHLHQISTETSISDSAHGTPSTVADISTLLSGKSGSELQAVLVESIRATLARVLSRSTDGMSTKMPVHEFGVDSLVAVELRSWLSKSVKVDVPMFEILGSSIEGLGELIVTRLESDT